MQILCLSKIAIGSVSNNYESPQNKDIYYPILDIDTRTYYIRVNILTCSKRLE